MYLILTNDFHHTQIRIRLPKTQHLRPRTCARIRKALCGVAGCTCGNTLGTRGIQRHNETTILVTPCPDGSAYLDYLPPTHMLRG